MLISRGKNVIVDRGGILWEEKATRIKTWQQWRRKKAVRQSLLPPYILYYILNGISTFAALYSLAHRHTFIFSSWIKGQWGEEVEGEKHQTSKFPP